MGGDWVLFNHCGVGVHTCVCADFIVEFLASLADSGAYIGGILTYRFEIIEACQCITVGINDDLGDADVTINDVAVFADGGNSVKSDDVAATGKGCLPEPFGAGCFRGAGLGAASICLGVDCAGQDSKGEQDGGEADLVGFHGAYDGGVLTILPK